MKGFTGSYDLGLWLFAGFGVCAWGTVIVALRSSGGFSGRALLLNGFPLTVRGEKNNVKCAMLNDKLIIH